MVGISLGTALLGSAIIGGGTAIAGASANSKAINNASAIEQRNFEASLAAQERARAENVGVLSPFVGRGNAAGEQINALLGIGGGTGALGAAASAPNWNNYLTTNPDVMQGYYATADRSRFATPQDYAQWHYGTYGANEGRAFPVTASVGASDPAAAARSAFDMFRNSTGYQFRVDEGNKAANAMLHAQGAFESGAAVKSAAARNQNIASAEFGNYIGYLANQQGVGLSGASALAGVGQNYANNVSSLNQNNAGVLSQLALAKGQNTNNMLGGLASSFGLGAGALSRWGG